MSKPRRTDPMDRYVYRLWCEVKARYPHALVLFQRTDGDWLAVQEDANAVNKLNHGIQVVTDYSGPVGLWRHARIYRAEFGPLIGTLACLDRAWVEVRLSEGDVVQLALGG